MSVCEKTCYFCKYWEISRDDSGGVLRFADDRLDVLGISEVGISEEMVRVVGICMIAFDERSDFPGVVTVAAELCRVFENNREMFELRENPIDLSEKN